MLIPRGLFVIGVGSHARSVADVALDLGVPALTFVDPSARCGQKICWLPGSDGHLGAAGRLACPRRSGRQLRTPTADRDRDRAGP